MLISNSYYTYTTDQQYVWWNASINSSSNSESIFELEMINVNKNLNPVSLRAFIDTEDRFNKNDWKQSYFNIFNENDEVVGFGYINIKEA